MDNETHAQPTDHHSSVAESGVATPPDRAPQQSPKAVEPVEASGPGSDVGNKRAIAALAFLLLLLLVLVMPSSFIVQQAGPAIDVSSELNGKPVVKVTGTRTHPSDTELVMTTVSAYGNAETGAPSARVLGALFSRDQQITPVRALYPQVISSEALATRNTQLMDNSQDTAAAVAFDLAGMDVSMTLKVAGINPEISSGKVLKEGDALLAIRAPATGKEYVDVATFRDLSQVLDKTHPGTKISLKVRRGTDVVEEEMTTLPYEPDESGWKASGSLLGILIEVQDLKLPAQAEYVVEGIGGPSAGSMFTMEIYDQITAGSLGGDTKIAGTGTMAWDGDIGPIGGIVHKLVGADGAGATDFLAPALNCAETIGYVPEGMHVWAVRTAEDAVEAIEAIGAGDTSALQSCESLVNQQLAGSPKSR